MQLAHANQAQISEVGMPICVALSQCAELRKMLPTVESQSHQTFVQHRQHQRNTLKMKSCFRQDGLAGQKRLADPLGDTNSPFVVSVVAIGERDQKPGIRDRLQDREKPFREDRSLGPRTVPASFMKDRLWRLRAFSS